MSEQCAECGGLTVWDDNVGSSICTDCGTLADPTQSVLSVHVDFTVNNTHDPWVSVANTTFKGRNGNTLPGQSKEARYTRNLLAMHEYIESVAIRLSARGVIQRAQTLFGQAMTQGKYRWGRRAKLTAGAALTAALREAKKCDVQRDIAYLLEERPEAVGSAFSSLVKLLHLNITPTDPTAHLSTVHSHMVTLLEGNTSALPEKLTTTVLPLLPRMMPIIRTAESLSAVISRTDILAKMPTEPTACALFMLAMEAEIQSSLPSVGVLAELLGSRFGVVKATVMLRYKVIQDLAEEWIREVPWLDAYECKNGRSKVAKRVIVARGLKDVIQFREEIWRKKLEATTKPRVDIDAGDADAEGERDTEYVGDSWQHPGKGEDIAGTSTAFPSLVRNDLVVPRPALKKRWKSAHERSVARASEFLLNPLGRQRTEGMHQSGAVTTPSTNERERKRKRGEADIDLLSHILTADTSNLPHVFAHPPSRLQYLSSTRTRSEGEIADEELFAEGELEGLIRTPEEASVLRTTMGWDVAEEDAVSAPEDRSRKRKRVSDEEGGKGKGTKKIDMDALARILNPCVDLDAVEYAFEGDGKDDDFSGDDKANEFLPSAEFDETLDPSAYIDDEGSVNQLSRPLLPADDGEVLEEWRPLSPGGGLFDEDRYDT